MGEDCYLFCRVCGEVHHITLFDKAPIYTYENGASQEVPADDCLEFVQRHSGHKVDQLRSLSESRIRGGRISDPMRVAYRQVTNGVEEFQLKTFRKSIGEPSRHMVLPRQLNLWNDDGA